MSATSASKRGKLPHLLAEQVRHFRRGHHAPGSVFPTKQALADQLGIAPMSALRLLAQLREWGFITSSPRHGTRVAAYLPHRHRFGLALYDQRDHLGSHCRALAEAARLVHADGATWEVFYGAADSARLCEALTLERLAGLVIPQADAFASLDLTRLRCPVIGSVRGDRSTPSHADLIQDEHLFIHTAAQHLLLNGRTRLAVLVDAFRGPQIVQREILKAQQALGFIHLPRWLQAAPLNRPAWARQGLDLLFDTNGDDRPDGLLVLDDHFLPVVEEFLRRPAGSDVGIAMQWNLPQPCPVLHPAISLIGWDMPILLASALAEMRNFQHHGWPMVQRRVSPCVLPMSHGDS